MTHCPTAVLANLTLLALCAAGVAQEDVAEREFAARKELHAAAPAVGTRVPDLVLVSLEGRPVALTSLRGRNVVLIRAGYTSQPFRDAVQGLNRLQQRILSMREDGFLFSSLPLATFLLVVRAEPAAGVSPFASIPQPRTFAERCALAERMRDELDVAMPIYVDDLDEASKTLFPDLESPVLVIDEQGRVVDKLATPDPDELDRALLRRVPKPSNAFPDKHWPESMQADFELFDASERAEGRHNDLWNAAEMDLRGRASLGCGPDGEVWPLLQRTRFALSIASKAHRPLPKEERDWFSEVDTLCAEAFRNEPMRLVAARVELAARLERCSDRTGWAALGDLPQEGALLRLQDWLRRREVSAEQRLQHFDDATRARVQARLAAHVRPLASALIDCRLAVVRVGFDEGIAYVLQGAEDLGVRFGRRLRLGEREAGMAALPLHGERTALVKQTLLLGKPYEATILEIAER